MRPPHVPARRLLACLALAAMPLPLGCGESKSDGSAAPVNQEANKKSMQASGDYYKDHHPSQKKK